MNAFVTDLKVAPERNVSLAVAPAESLVYTYITRVSIQVITNSLTLGHSLMLKFSPLSCSLVVQDTSLM